MSKVLAAELEDLRKRAEESLPAYRGDTERLMTVPAPTMLRLLDLLRVTIKPEVSDWTMGICKGCRERLCPSIPPRSGRRPCRCACHAEAATKSVCDHPPFACRVSGKCACECSMCIQPGVDPRPVRRSAQAESAPAPKLNDDEMQCDGCGLVVAVREDIEEPYCKVCQPVAR